MCRVRRALGRVRGAARGCRARAGGSDRSPLRDGAAVSCLRLVAAGEGRGWTAALGGARGAVRSRCAGRSGRRARSGRTPASCAIASKVTGWPVVSRRRRAATARRRVCSVRFCAAASRCRELSARLGSPAPADVGLDLDLDDHAVEVGQDLLVHLDHPAVAGALCAVDEGEGAAAVFLQFGQGLRSGQEDRTGQAGVGVEGRSAAPGGRTSRAAESGSRCSSASWPGPGPAVRPDPG